MVTQGGVAGSSAIGERDPQGVQRLLYPAGWDADVGFATTRADAWSSTSRTGRGAPRGGSGVGTETTESKSILDLVYAGAARIRSTRTTWEDGTLRLTGDPEGLSS